MKHTLLILVFISLVIPNSSHAGGGHGHDHEKSHDHDTHKEDSGKGPHGGKLLSQDDLSLEITIFETNAPPQYRVYPFYKGKPLDGANIKVKITLTRFGGKKEEFQFVSEHDYLTSQKIVEEPHSFDISVLAEYDGKTFEWSYESHEGRTELSKEALNVAVLGFDIAGPQEISNTTRVYGKLLPNENKVAHLIPRFPGIIRKIQKQLGESVEKGEVLAVVESNQSLQSYEIRSEVQGIVISRHATVGEFVNETREIFVVADLSEIWADFQLYRDDFGPIEAGQRISVDLGDGKEIPATISYVSPIIDETTQSKLVRAVLPNPTSSLRPGLFVSGVLSSVGNLVPVAVKREAVQTFRDWNVVYLTDGDVFQAIPVELGRKDAEYIEILSGITAGERYVSKNSFIIKADIEKSGASHDH